ncbi:hypothetical protein MHZ89_11960 [Pantoea sp. ACRSB]|nr:hypothetical protein [Pantoea sp. ACRSB]
MKKLMPLALIVFELSACSYDNYKITPPPQNQERTMPDIFQSVTPAQQRAIMSGERPDWTETPPVKVPHR